MPAAEAAAAARAAAERAARRSATSPQEGGRPGQQGHGGRADGPTRAKRGGAARGREHRLRSPGGGSASGCNSSSKGSSRRGSEAELSLTPGEREARPSGPRLTWAEGQTGPLAPSNEEERAQAPLLRRRAREAAAAARQLQHGGGRQGQRPECRPRLRVARQQGAGGKAAGGERERAIGRHPPAPCVTAAGGRAAAGPGGPHHASPHQRRGGLRGSAAEAASGTRRPRQHSERARGQRPAEPLLPGRSAAVGRFGPRGEPAGGRRTSSRSAGPAPRAER